MVYGVHAIFWKKKKSCRTACCQQSDCKREAKEHKWITKTEYQAVDIHQRKISVWEIRIFFHTPSRWVLINTSTTRRHTEYLVFRKLSLPASASELRTSVANLKQEKYSSENFKKQGIN